MSRLGIGSAWLGLLGAAVAVVAGGEGVVRVKPAPVVSTIPGPRRDGTIRHSTVRSYDRHARRKDWISARQQRKLAKALRRGTLTAQAVRDARQGGAL